MKTLGQAADYVREAVAFVLNVQPDSFDLTVEPELPEDVAREALEARAAVRRAEEEQAKAAAASRRVARRLKSLGMSGKDAGLVLGVSQQRVSQLLTKVEARVNDDDRGSVPD